MTKQNRFLKDWGMNKQLYPIYLPDVPSSPMGKRKMCSFENRETHIEPCDEKKITVLYIGTEEKKKEEEVERSK